VDILVNGTVVFNWKGVLEMPLEEWRRQIDIILLKLPSPKHYTRAAVFLASDDIESVRG